MKPANRHLTPKQTQEAELDKADCSLELTIDNSQIKIWALRRVLAGFSTVRGGRDYLLEQCGIGSKSLDKDETTKIYLQLKQLEEDGEQHLLPLPIENNCLKISKLLDLNKAETELLRYFTAVALSPKKTLDGIRPPIYSEKDYIEGLSFMLNLKQKDVDKVVSGGSKLLLGGILNLKQSPNKGLFLSNRLVDAIKEPDFDASCIYKEYVKECSKGSLTLSDFEHVKEFYEIVFLYLKNALKERKIGCNILIYGAPGVGKTEFVKMLSSKLRHDLYEVAHITEENEHIDLSERIQGLSVAQSFLSSKKAIYLFEHAEELFGLAYVQYGLVRRFIKVNPVKPLQVNPLICSQLDSNIFPVIWIANSVENADPAILKRFDICFEMPMMSKRKRVEIIKKLSDFDLSDATVKTLSSKMSIAPAAVSRVNEVIAPITQQLSNASQAAELLITETLKAHGHRKSKSSSAKSSDMDYKPEYVNASVDLKKIAENISRSKEARICLFGPPGTGKSAFGKWLANYIDKPVLLKKASDIIDPYVGMTERNISKAFKTAKEEEAVLIFDEVDSFLLDRSGNSRSWETSMTNEMLVQMEEYKGIFIATTNLKDSIDAASIRRFDLKVEFGYMSAEQALSMFLHYCETFGFEAKPSHKNAVSSIANLTPGDFATINRQSRCLPVGSIDELIERLSTEVKMKNESGGKRLGFMG